MQNFGGRVCLTENRLGPNYVANRALKKEEKWLEKVSGDCQRQLSREEAKMRKSLERLKAVKSNTKSKMFVNGATPIPSRLGGHASHYERDNISQQSHHKPSRSNYHDTSGRHGPPSHHPDAQHSSRKMVRSKMKIGDHHQANNESIPPQRSGRVYRSGQHPIQHDPASQFNPAVAHLNIKHNPGQHQDVHNDGGTSVKLTLPQIQNLNEAMAHLHVPMTTITVDDHDHDDHVSSPGSHSRVSKNNTSSMRNIYDEAIQKITTVHDPSPRFSENNSTSSMQSESRRHRNSVDKLPEIDKHAFRDLENIVKEAKQRKKEVGASNYASRHNRRRLQHLEQLLEELRPRVKAEIPFDPVSILECRYLRLSKANVENLENMIREKGMDPVDFIHFKEN
ncbi:hypothetical protein LOTGIDRAFT_235933 [Lottia gigantea]|uniref:Uncharacterized protein n=1 Tax=Lottia gigantea TaxID=225164 RepID=V3ZVU8_LOTGI|nr:hypothetical protein LOTGIDRAFT_235933 [Lottia gigantea]ESO85071.1 hypothetical protein LOTGIDRAFT_235933 [Lottia gigantea]